MNAQQLWDEAEREEKNRADAMPTEQDAINQMFQAYQRLKELGWNSVSYCPKDGSMFDAIEAGSIGIAPTKYDGEQRRGRFWAYEANDIWPSSPILFKVKESKDGNS